MSGESGEAIVLVTGFEPFGSHDLNPSALLAMQLDGMQVGAARVVGAELPVAHGRAMAAFTAAVDRYRPSIVLSLGLAAGRGKLALERVGINVLDFPIADNDGTQPDGPIVPDGPAAYFATLPIKAILAAWKEERIPGYISNTAGTYLCNEILYLSLHLAAAHGYRAGFIHVPCLPEQAARMGDTMPSMSLDVMLRGIEHAIEVTLAPAAEAMQGPSMAARVIMPAGCCSASSSCTTRR